MFLNRHARTILNECTSNQVLFHEKHLAALKKTIFSVLALYTNKTLQSLSLLKISINKDVLFIALSTYGKKKLPMLLVLLQH